MPKTPTELRQLADRGFGARPNWSPDGAGSSPLHDGFHAITQADAAMLAFAETVAKINADPRLTAEGRREAIAAAARAALQSVEKLTGIADRLDQVRAQAAVAAAPRDAFGDDHARRLDVASRLWDRLPDNVLDSEIAYRRALEAGDDLVMIALELRPSLYPGAFGPEKLATLKAARLAAVNPAGARYLAQLDDARRDVRRVLDLATADLKAAATPPAEDIKINHQRGNVRVPLDQPAD